MVGVAATGTIHHNKAMASKEATPTSMAHQLAATIAMEHHHQAGSMVTWASVSPMRHQQLTKEQQQYGQQPQSPDYYQDQHRSGQPGYDQYPPSQGGSQGGYGRGSGPGAYADSKGSRAPPSINVPGNGPAEGERGIGASLIGAGGGGFLGHELGGGMLGAVGGAIAGAIGANLVEKQLEK
jgi:hypothetical protein